jgi:ElaA protein
MMGVTNDLWLHYDDLSKDQLYDLMSLRQQVFVVEQNCPYLDVDGDDQNAYHLLSYLDDNLIGYLRAFKGGIKYESPSIGRVVTNFTLRGAGHGRRLMRLGIARLRKMEPKKKIVISAQHRLKAFYEELNFYAVGDIYLEDNIDHIEMHLDP